MNLLQLVIDKFDGTIVDEYGTEHFTIPGKKYDIQLSERREWSCDCPAFKWRHKFKRKTCKHIKEVKEKRFKWLIQ